MSKFIQIEAVTDDACIFPYLFALDEDGQVWAYIEGKDGKMRQGKWYQMSAEREPSTELVTNSKQGG